MVVVFVLLIMTICSESVIHEVQGIVEDVVPMVSEETDLLLQVVPLPQGELVELLNGHPENTEELLLREVFLQSGPVHTRWQLAPSSVSHHQHLVGVNLML